MINHVMFYGYHCFHKTELKLKLIVAVQYAKIQKI